MLTAFNFLASLRRADSSSQYWLVVRHTQTDRAARRHNHRVPMVRLLAGIMLVGIISGCSTLTAGRADTNGPTSTSAVQQASYNQATDRLDAPSALPERPSQSAASWNMDDLNPKNWSKTFDKLTGQQPDQAAAQARFADGQRLYREALASRQQHDAERAADLFDDAASKFASAAKLWPASALEEDALFLTAESNFFADQYVTATENMERLLKKYPNTRYLDMVGARRFVIAKYWLDLDTSGATGHMPVNLTDSKRPRTDTFGYAIRVLNKMRLDDPLGKLADDATLAAGNAYFARGDFAKADSFYTDLRTSFPSSEHQFLAHFLGIKAKLESYQGPEYAGSVLDQAKKLIKQTRRQFPQEVSQHGDDIDRAEREVRYRKAEREWFMVQYYARRREFGAARFYANILVKDYRETPFAEKARARLTEYTGKPAVPEQKLAWLAKIFSNSAKEKPLIATAPTGKTRR